jgi:3-phosphoshikimate 1-carboxyvinyltransferase
MRLHITPGNPLRGEASLPGDKSISHRAALFAALAEGESRFDHFLISGVTRAMLEALSALGIPWKLHGEHLSIIGRGLHNLKPPSRAIDCGNSGTTMRLLAGALAGAGVPAVLDGSQGLRMRPMRRIVAPLQEMGVAIQDDEGRAPLKLGVSQIPLRAIDHTLPVASAQVKSCLLLAALAAEGTTTLREPGPSRDHTERMLRSMGVNVTSDQAFTTGDVDLQVPKTEYITRLTSPSPVALAPLEMYLPADFSSAAFLIVAALISPGSEIVLRGVGLNPTRTGLLEVLVEMGADIQVYNQDERGGEPVGDLRICNSQLVGTQICGDRVVRMIDEFPAFAAAAAYAEGESEVSQAEELRHKESDRISALCAGLRALGISARERRDGFTLSGEHAPRGGIVDAGGDHRLGMAFAIAGLAAREPVTIEGAQVIAESFPAFTRTLTQLGARVVQSQ